MDLGSVKDLEHLRKLNSSIQGIGLSLILSQSFIHHPWKFNKTLIFYMDPYVYKLYSCYIFLSYSTKKIQKEIVEVWHAVLSLFFKATSIKKRFLDICNFFTQDPFFFPSGECQIKLHLSNVNYIFSNYVQQGTIINVML